MAVVRCRIRSCSMFRGVTHRFGACGRSGFDLCESVLTPFLDTTKLFSKSCCTKKRSPYNKSCCKRATNQFLGSSMVEHAAVNRAVVGSSPTRGARTFKTRRKAGLLLSRNYAYTNQSRPSIVLRVQWRLESANVMDSRNQFGVIRVRASAVRSCNHSSAPVIDVFVYALKMYKLPITVHTLD